VDLIAHSQGGWWWSASCRFEYDASDPTFPPIGTVVTLASRTGAPLASTVAELRRSARTRKALAFADRIVPGRRRARRRSPSWRGLAVHGPAPRGAAPGAHRLTTVGGTDDVVVPANRIRVPGATEVVVDVADSATRRHPPRPARPAGRAQRTRAPAAAVHLGARGLRSAVAPVLISRVEGDLGEHLTTYLEVRTWK